MNFISQRLSERKSANEAAANADSAMYEELKRVVEAINEFYEKSDRDVSAQLQIGNKNSFNIVVAQLSIANVIIHREVNRYFYSVFASEVQLEGISKERLADYIIDNT